MPEPLPAGTKARRKPPKIDENALSLALVHHIDDLKRGARGRITQVHHIKMGWMTLADYYDLQKMHELMPIYTKIVEGAYRLKAVIFASEFNVEILGSGVTVPVGPALIGLTTAAAVAKYAAGDPQGAALLMLALALPFGEIYLLWLFWDALFSTAGNAAKDGWLGPVAAAATGGDWETVALGPIGGAAAKAGLFGRLENPSAPPA